MYIYGGSAEKHNITTKNITNFLFGTARYQRASVKPQIYQRASVNVDLGSELVALAASALVRSLLTTLLPAGEDPEVRPAGDDANTR